MVILSSFNWHMFVHLNIFYLKDVREQCDKLKETVSSKDKKLARMNKAFGNKVNNNVIGFPNTYLLNRDLRCAWRYPVFE